MALRQFFPFFFHIYKTRLLESEVGGKEFDIIPSEAAVELKGGSKNVKIAIHPQCKAGKRFSRDTELYTKYLPRKARSGDFVRCEKINLLVTAVKGGFRVFQSCAP